MTPSQTLHHLLLAATFAILLLCRPATARSLPAAAVNHTTCYLLTFPADCLTAAKSFLPPRAGSNGYLVLRAQVAAIATKAALTSKMAKFGPRARLDEHKEAQRFQCEKLYSGQPLGEYYDVLTDLVSSHDVLTAWNEDIQFWPRQMYSCIQIIASFASPELDKRHMELGKLVQNVNQLFLKLYEL